MATANPDDNEVLSWGGPCPRLNVPVIELSLNKKSKVKDWVDAIWGHALDRGVDEMVYTDGSQDEKGRTGGGWYREVVRPGDKIEGEVKGGIWMGYRNTIWDGEIAGVLRALQKTPQDRRVLICTDSQAAIEAIQKASKKGTARTGDLRWVLQEVDRRQKTLGPNAVIWCWVKAHIGIPGNEIADQEAKKITEMVDWERESQITEGGLKQWIRKERKEMNGRAEGGWMQRAIKWKSRKAQASMAACRTEKGQIRTWQKKLKKRDDATCRYCKSAEESGHHLVFQCKIVERPIRPAVLVDKERKKREKNGGRLTRYWEDWHDLECGDWFDDESDLAQDFFAKLFKKENDVEEPIISEV